MPSVYASLEYLQKLGLYDHEKPYWLYLAPRQDFDPNTEPINNLEFESHEGILIQDLRELHAKADINECGFQVISHQSKVLQFSCIADIQDYRSETEQLLREALGAVHVKCYDTVLRKNVTFERNQLDLADPLRTEDITYKSGPEVIDRYLSKEAISEFLQPGYRIRIINTWRALVPVLENRPLALCDSRSVAPEDLVAADRVIPGQVGEVYYLTHSSNHKWFWLEKQTPSEPFVFVMYDTKAGNHARCKLPFCPHVSFENPYSPEGAAPRESIETRSIVITKEYS
ncbi:hypothetical protein DL98DRAFT_431000 [Cadophora sp. DSE1049]|nr:hypothetical protein DL98DRAFT_431000 [Cadophora sp. DSE1049]